MYHGKFPVEHGRVRTRLLGTPEYIGNEIMHVASLFPGYENKFL